MRRVIVTGASGFIGRHTIPALTARGYEVHAVALRRTWPMANVVWHAANLLDRNETTELVDKVQPTHLLHFAWYAEHGKFWRSRLNLDWVASSISLFNAFVEIGGRRAVFAGTCGEYDWSGSGPFIEGSTPSNPRTLYAVCKNSTRQVVQSAAQEADVSVAWGRIFFLYGPDEHPDRLVPSILNPLRNNRPACVRCGDHVRDLLHVYDVASAFVHLLDSPVTGTVNVASGQGVTLAEVAREAAVILGRSALLTVDRQVPTPENPRVVVADNRRLLDEVGWAPKYDLVTGLEQVVTAKEGSMHEPCDCAFLRRPHAASGLGFRSQPQMLN